jgi:uncharacterized membrane protein
MKELIISRKKEFKNIFALCFLSSSFLVVRLILDYSPNKFFILWNLFLASVPYLLVLQLGLRKNISSFHLIITFIIWLLFLPNAPYIITDLKHIKIVAINDTLFESLFILSFTISGLYFGFLSLRDMIRALQEKGWLTNKIRIYIFQNVILSLTAVGIYLGRELRWNSWDLFQKPKSLFDDMIALFLDPKEHLDGWVFIISMSIFLMVTFKVFQNNKTHHINDQNL